MPSAIAVQSGTTARASRFHDGDVAQELQQVGCRLRLDADVAAGRHRSLLHAALHQGRALAARRQHGARAPIDQASVRIAEQAASRTGFGLLLVDAARALIGVVDAGIDGEADIVVAGRAHAVDVFEAGADRGVVIKFGQHEENRRAGGARILRLGAAASGRNRDVGGEADVRGAQPLALGLDRHMQCRLPAARHAQHNDAIGIDPRLRGEPVEGAGGVGIRLRLPDARLIVGCAAHPARHKAVNDQRGEPLRGQQPAVIEFRMRGDTAARIDDRRGRQAAFELRPEQVAGDLLLVNLAGVEPAAGQRDAACQCPVVLGVR